MTRDEAFHELVQAVRAALETYSNVHRGSGQHSVVSTHLYEQAREVVLSHLGLDAGRHVVVFGTPLRAAALAAQLPAGTFRSVSSDELGLPLGIRALAVERSALPRTAPRHSGGGTARLVGLDSVVWARVPDRFEAGTPAIVNVIALAKALKLIEQHGKDAFRFVGEEPEAKQTDLDGLAGRPLLEALRGTLIGGGARVPTAEGLRPYVNLDNAASTPTFEPIWNAVRRAWRQPRETRQQTIDEARATCSKVLGAPLEAYDVVFTGNTTEAINLVAESLAKGAGPGRGIGVLNTFLEHNSNELPWRTTPGLSLLHLAVDDEGFVDLNELEAALRAHNEPGASGRRIALVAVTGASNVLGAFNDLPAISRVVHQYGARLLVDGAQMVAHRKVDLAALDVDYFACSAHKVYAPFGSGALVVRKGLLAFDEAEREGIRASGEENVGGIAALGAALGLLQRIGLDVIEQDERALTRRAVEGLAKLPKVTIYGTKDVESPRFAQKGAVVAFAVDGMLPGNTGRALAERFGIGVRWGCHCAHLFIRRMLHIPAFFQWLQGVVVRVAPRLELPGVVRASFGLQTTEAEVDALVEAVRQIVAEPKKKAAATKRQVDDFAAEAGLRVYRAGA
ncbi:MAG: aminotransferase class V-fold PLP-dependent enzyme [Myxococcales bacterium]